MHLGGSKQRALLALLLLNRNTSVASDRLVDELWPAPANRRHKLEVAISRLRKTLEDAGLPRELLATTTNGYVLHVGRGQVDTERFDLLVERGRELVAAGRFADAEKTLVGALGLWRGDALADVRYADFAQAEIRRLEELRAVAGGELIDARIGLGRSADVVPELRRTVAAHPLRERPRAQLMHALYAAGRRAEALEAYRDTRRVFVDELGLEPSAELRELERRMLDADPTLAHPTSERVAEPPPSRPTVGVRPLIPALAAVLIVLTASAAPQRTNNARARQATLPPDWLAVVDAKTNRVVRRLQVGDRPVAVAVGDGAAWVANADDATVTRVDLATYRTQTVGIASTPADVLVSEGSVWVATLSPDLVRVHAATVQVSGTFAVDPGKLESYFNLGTIRIPIHAAHVTAGAGSVWVSNTIDSDTRGVLFRVDPDDGGVTQFRTAARADSRHALAFGDGALWSGRAIGGDEFSPDDGDSPPPYVVYRTDPHSGHVVARLELRVPPTALAFGGGFGWLAQNSGRRVSQLDERFATIERTIQLPRAPTDIAADDEAVWIASADARAVYRLDPDPLHLVATIRLGRQPESIALGGGRVWIVGS